VIPAILLILLGVYLLLNQLGIGIPGWGEMWPVFPFAAGLIFLGQYIFGRRGDPGLVFLGIAATLVGVVFFFITLGPFEYADLSTWWPVFVLIGGLAFLGQWAAAGFRDWGALFLGLVALAVGAVAFALNLQLLGPGTQALLPRLWPVLIILVGLIALLRALVGRRR
jgi:hypothetical protein